MIGASEEIRVLGGDADIVDTSVSCDRTWQKRGFTSLNGAAICLSIDTGKVVVGVMSRYCQACVISVSLEKSDPDKFEDSQAHHKPDCRINHMGSATVMEAEGMINIVLLTSNHSIKKVKAIELLNRSISTGVMSPKIPMWCMHERVR